jgi:hypothetical protein
MHLLFPPLDAFLLLITKNTTAITNRMTTIGTATAMPKHAGPHEVGSSKDLGKVVVDWLFMATEYAMDVGL